MSEAKRIFNEVFNTPGFSTGLSLSEYELNFFRACIQSHYLDTISKFAPALRFEFEKFPIDHYHEISHLVDHTLVWSKFNRCLPQIYTSKIKNFEFLKRLESIFGAFKISDIVYDQTHMKDSEEVYWRLVRPNAATDIGPLHADKWFHEVLSSEYIPKGTTSLKVWIPIYCEPGKNGLLMVPDSHKKEWNYNFVTTPSGQKKPLIINPPPSILINTPPGNMIIFPDGTLHGGALNDGLKTRVSAEITLLLLNPKTS